MLRKENQDFWTGRAKEIEQEKQVTHNDFWLRHVEIELIKRYLKPSDRVLDVGCGNGYTCRQIASLVQDVVGVDINQAMIDRAIKESGKENFTYHCNEFLDMIAPIYDVIISERFLINLSGCEEQRQALQKMCELLKSDGLLIICETIKSGRERLNELRKMAGLSDMPVVPFNVDFETTDALDLMVTRAGNVGFCNEESLEVYDFISRVVHPAFVAPDKPRYDSKMNEVAAKLCLASHGLSYRDGRTAFKVYRKRGSDE